jgi:hypothetical protein
MTSTCHFLSTLRTFRDYAEKTKVYYQSYIKRSEEQRLSFQIFNSHVRHFHEALVKFLEHAHFELPLLKGLGNEGKGLNPREWHEFTIGKTRMSKEEALNEFLLYNPKISVLGEMDSDQERINTTCVSELTNLMGEIEEFAESVEEELAVRPACGHVRHSHVSE